MWSLLLLKISDILRSLDSKLLYTCTHVNPLFTVTLLKAIMVQFSFRQILQWDLNTKGNYRIQHKWSLLVHFGLHVRILCIVNIPVMSEHLFMNGSISAVMPKWTLVTCFYSKQASCTLSTSLLLHSLSFLLWETLLTFASLMSL